MLTGTVARPTLTDERGVRRLIATMADAPAAGSSTGKRSREEAASSTDPTVAAAAATGVGIVGDGSERRERGKWYGKAAE